MHESDDHLAAGLDFLGAAVQIRHPVKCLLRRRDVIAKRRKQNDRRADLAQIECLAA